MILFIRFLDNGWFWGWWHYGKGVGSYIGIAKKI